MSLWLGVIVAGVLVGLGLRDTLPGAHPLLVGLFIGIEAAALTGRWWLRRRSS
jgi:hypothetical protein